MKVGRRLGRGRGEIIREGGGKVERESICGERVWEKGVGKIMWRKIQGKGVGKDER